MEKRRSKRTVFNFDAVIVSRSLNCRGIIKDFSDDGISVHIQAGQNFCQLMGGMLFEVKYALPSGENINLQCEVIRTHRIPADTSENIIGMKIINQPPEYGEFLKNHR